ncbi:putative membrane-anchored protein [Pseudaminobacter salicylatoxidans]|uniref:Putative membrane-anchored protein n=1 Tax=Pseudaminobacter salicylatoxidans TaxID=93369 RepID=A0A316CA19_PSESE|nr:DUF3422 family protein [Pseudaminobacter salicylatoxidans]PWJ86611.1 putative membrane-anchored protein [Pseudaminobacter salicylatoxidans]
MTDNPSSLEFLPRATGSVMGFPAHAERAGALGEVHSRPHPMVEAPRALIQLSFMTDAGSSVDHAVLCELSRRLGIAAPDRQARHHAMKWGQGSVRWERHTEFSTYLWEGPLGETGRAWENSPFGNGFSPPGTVISAIRVEIREWTPASEKLIAGFDPASLCYSLVENGAAAIVTDFRQDADGLTRILVLDRGMTPARAGALSQRLIDIETYRTLALLGLPMALSLSGQVRRMEDSLAQITREMKSSETRDSQTLLANLTELAAELEADAAASLYRFGASRAYDGIVRERLEALEEEAVPGHQTWAGFLQRRMAPAMRTCRSVEERQANLSRKLTRTTTLLRTWVDVEVEKQNRDLLASMNNRARLQLRLQQTVEGLSVAAVSYYVVGLVGYVAKGASAASHAFSPETATALAVLPVVLLVWWGIRRIRHAHQEHKSQADD